MLFPFLQIKSIWILLVFILVVILIIKSLNSNNNRNGIFNKIKLDFGTIPLAGVLLLAITFSLDKATYLRGILGNHAIHPYAILILFFSLAYICISIDQTGLFSFISFKIAKNSGKSSLKLFVTFYFISGIMTIFTSNDIVILTLTPIILYFTKYTNLNPLPFLIAQFFSANIWSCFLYIGNPTNIIVAQAFDLGFLEYLRWSFFPTIASGFAALVMMLFVFRKELRQPIQILDTKEDIVIKDRLGAFFGMIVLLSCLVLLSLDFFIQTPLWIICLSCSLIMLSKDILFDLFKSNVFGFRSGILLNFSPKNVAGVIHQDRVYESALSLRVIRIMPWKVFPFALGMFIIVEGLVYAGWVDLIAQGMTIISQSLPSALIVFMSVSVIFSNLMNNQPMTILFTQVLLSSSFLVPGSAQFGSQFALIMGSNFGANFTPLGALAGIMWIRILSEKGTTVSYRQFLRYGFSIMPIVLLVAVMVLFLEIQLTSR